MGPTLISERDRLARSLRRRLARDAAARSIQEGLAGLAIAVLFAEALSRLFAVPALRSIELVLLASAATITAWLILRRRPSPAAWIPLADIRSPEPGLFSASAAAASSRFGPLVAERAERVAAALVAAPSRSGPVSIRARRVAALFLAAVAMCFVPGRKGPEALDPDVALRIARQGDDLGQATGALDAADRAALARLAAALERGDLRPADLAPLSAELRRIADRNAIRVRAVAGAVADAAAKRPWLEPSASALRNGDAARLDEAARTLERLLDGDRIPSAERESARRDMELAAPGDQDVADLAEAIGAGRGGASADALRRFGARLDDRRRATSVLNDVVVTLDAATHSTALAGSPGASPAPPGPGTSVPEVASLTSGRRSLAPEIEAAIRPGSADELILRRYFAVE